MSLAEVRLGEADDEIHSFFDAEKWSDAEAEATEAESGVMYDLYPPVRRAATALLEQITQGDLGLEPTESLTNSNLRFYKENYNPGTLLGFSVGYLRKSMNPTVPKGKLTKALKFPGKPRQIVYGNPTEGIVPSATAHYRQVEAVDGWEISDATYTAYDWFGVVVDNGGGKRDLFSLSDTGGSGVSRLLFPKHEPAIVGYPTVTRGIDTKGALIETYELISRLDIYQYPILWEHFMKEYGPSKLGKIATGVKTKAKDIIK
jgi:hypothetical protein